jgi:hypothetical protein
VRFKRPMFQKHLLFVQRGLGRAVAFARWIDEDGDNEA